MLGGGREQMDSEWKGGRSEQRSQNNNKKQTHVNATLQTSYGS